MEYQGAHLFVNARSRLGYELYSIWLFTRSDLKTIVIPSSFFGVLGGLCRSALTVQGSSNTNPHSKQTDSWNRGGLWDVDILWRTPLVVLWVWLVLLPFNIDNQRRAEAIAEDRINRPWRPLPAKRMTPEQAFRLMLVCHGVALVYSATVGGLPQSLLGIALGWLYNGLGAADKSCIAKNFVNALGYVTFTVGAVAVAVDNNNRGGFSETGLKWFALVGAVVFSTVHMQDLPDQEGDAARKRRTVPLVLGERLSRWSIANLVPLWSIIAATFWGLSPLYSLSPLTVLPRIPSSSYSSSSTSFASSPSSSYLPYSCSSFHITCAAYYFASLPAHINLLLAITISWRVLNKTTVADDTMTFRIWNLWMVSLYALPLASAAQY